VQGNKKNNRGWGAEGRKITWSSWENVCKPKEEGDLGIRRIDLFRV